MSPSLIWRDKITNQRVAWVGYNHFISNKGEWNNCFSKFSNRVLPRIFISAILQASGKSIQLRVTRAPTPAISWLLHNKKLRKRQSVVNLCRKPSSNYLTGQIQGKQTILEESVNLAHYFPYDVKLRLLAHSQIFLANQKARNAIVGAENLLRADSVSPRATWLSRHLSSLNQSELEKI